MMRNLIPNDIKSLDDVLATVLPFRVWRWWFTRYRLPKIINKSLDTLKEQYEQYEQYGGSSSFENWCGRLDKNGDWVIPLSADNQPVGEDG